MPRLLIAITLMLLAAPGGGVGLLQPDLDHAGRRHLPRLRHVEERRERDGRGALPGRGHGAHLRELVEGLARQPSQADARRVRPGRPRLARLQLDRVRPLRAARPGQRPEGLPHDVPADSHWASERPSVCPHRIGGYRSLGKSCYWKPRPDLFGKFVAAVAKRYRGQVSLYSIWNEPNLEHYLYPQKGRGSRGPVDVAAKRYRSLWYAGYRAIRRHDPARRNKVLFGETAAISSPLDTLYAALCLNEQGRPFTGSLQAAGRAARGRASCRSPGSPCTPTTRTPRARPPSARAHGTRTRCPTPTASTRCSTGLRATAGSRAVAASGTPSSASNPTRRTASAASRWPGTRGS